MSTIVFSPQQISNSTNIAVPPNALCKALEFVNETPYLMMISLSGAYGSFFLQPYTTRYKNVPGFGNGDIQVAIIAAMNGSGQAPLNLFGLVSYGPEDPDQADFIIQSDRLNSIGNAASVGTANSSVVNDGNAAQNVLEATLQGSTGSNSIIKNDGTVQFAEYVSSVYNKLFQINPGAATALLLGLASRTVEVLGDLKIDGSLNTAGVNVYGVLQSQTGGSVKADILNSGANLPGGGLGISAANDLMSYNGTNLKLRSAGGVALTIGGVDILTATSNGTIISTGKIGQTVSGDIIDASGANDIYVKAPGAGRFNFQAPSGTTTWSRMAESHGVVSGVAPNATATITHNLKVNGVSVQPDQVLVTPNNSAASTATWTTMNVGSTTFQIYNSNNGVTQTFYWHCIKF